MAKIPRLRAPRLYDIALTASQITFGVSWMAFMRLEVTSWIVFITNVGLTGFLWYIVYKYAESNKKYAF